MPMGSMKSVRPVTAVGYPMMQMGPMKSVRFIGAVTAVGYPARDANGPHEISTLHRGCDCCRISCP